MVKTERGASWFGKEYSMDNNVQACPILYETWYKDLDDYVVKGHYSAAQHMAHWICHGCVHL